MALAFPNFYFLDKKNKLQLNESDRIR